MHVSHRYVHYQVVELLMNRDPDIKIQSKYGATALMIACYNVHKQVLELLLYENPDLNIQDND